MHEEQQEQGQGGSHSHDGPPLEAETGVSGVGHGSQHGEASYRDSQGVHRLILLQSSEARGSRHGGPRPGVTYRKREGERW